MSVSFDPIIKMLDKKDLMRLFKVSKSTIERIVRSRQIPFYKIGGTIRFNQDEIVSFMQRNRVETIGTKNYGSSKI